MARQFLKCLQEVRTAACQVAVTAMQPATAILGLQQTPSRLLAWAQTATTQTHHLSSFGQKRLYRSSSVALDSPPAPSSRAAAAAHVMSQIDPSRIRNLCIIAHIDHGKTTLADQLLKQAWALDAGQTGPSNTAATQEESVSLDSGDLERERGITILSKVTSFTYKGHVINLVDTPGHADFGGEVERVLGLVDGAVLVVDASEGPLAQTKFVLGKALARGLAPLVLLNKVDKESATSERCSLVESSLFDLFANLGANDQQLDFPLLFSSARQGWASRSLPAGESRQAPPGSNMEPLLDMLVAHVPPPKACTDTPFTFSVAMVERDPYVGRIVTGRVHSGQLRPGDTVQVLTSSSASQQQQQQQAAPTLHKVVRITKRVGMQDIQLDRAVAGDVVSLAGVPGAIADTIAAPGVTEALDAGHMDPPTLSMVFGANDSPFAGRAGKAVTGRVIGERLMAQAETSVSLTVQQLAGHTERYEVCARGEMQLAVLVEGMRREGMEVAVSPPAVLTRTEDDVLLEPIEEVTAEVDDDVAGQIIELLSVRKGELLDMLPVQGGRQRLVFKVPSRGLIGFKSTFVNLTRGEGLLSRAFLAYEKHRGAFTHVRKGVMIANSEGPATRHALTELMQRGTFFVSPGEEVYEGQVVGEHVRDEDLEINPTRLKHLTNVRSTKREITVPLPPARVPTLEEAIGFVAADELIEVTPAAVRVRKVELNTERRRQATRQARHRDRS